MSTQREVLTMIIDDMEADTVRREGLPFTGRAIAEAFGEVSATIQALAKLQLAHLDECHSDNGGS